MQKQMNKVILLRKDMKRKDPSYLLHICQLVVQQLSDVIEENISMKSYYEKKLEKMERHVHDLECSVSDNERQLKTMYADMVSYKRDIEELNETTENAIRDKEKALREKSELVKLIEIKFEEFSSLYKEHADLLKKVETQDRCRHDTLKDHHSTFLIKVENMLKALEESLNMSTSQFCMILNTVAEYKNEIEKREIHDGKHLIETQKEEVGVSEASSTEGIQNRQELKSEGLGAKHLEVANFIQPPKFADEDRGGCSKKEPSDESDDKNRPQ